MICASLFSCSGGTVYEVHSHTDHWSSGGYPAVYIQQNVCNGKPKLRLIADRQGLVCLDVAATAAYVAHFSPAPELPALEYVRRTAARVPGRNTPF